MKLIFKYLKPYWLAVIAVIGLTLLQVTTELALPDYMSDIVTNGIQYGGIKQDIPLAVTESDMNIILRFVDNSNQVLSEYDFLNAGNDCKIDKQEITLDENVYILKQDYKDIKDILQKPIIYNYLLSQSNMAIDYMDKAEIIKLLDEQLIGLEENQSSLVKFAIQQLYFNVGLSTEKIQSNYILSVGLKMLGVAAIGVVFLLSSTYLSTRVSAKIGSNIRKDVFEKVESFSASEFSKFSTSSLITRTGNDVTKIQQLIQMMLRMMLMSPMMGITAVFKVAQYPNISWLLVVAICLIICIMIVLAIFVLPKFEVMQKLTDRLNSVTREFLDGMLVIRAFNSQEKEEKKFDEVNSDTLNLDRFVNRAVNIVGPAITIIMNVLTISITWFAAKQIDIDAMSIGDMMAFSQYAMHVLMSFMFVTMTFFMIPRSLVSVKRIKEVLDTKNTIVDKENAEELPNENGDLVFDNVSFKYPGAEESVLENISFVAKPGETVAFIGSTGSGKSTVVKLVPRLFDVTAGCITYCGKDIRDVNQQQLHDKIGFASQKATLFMGDIKSNIAFGRQISEEELNQAIAISQSQNIIEEKENGVNELITQGGTNVSGGQKQRLSIARALAKDKNIYIFDDCFSALDYETDKKLRSELNKLIEKTKATVLIVAQRISTIKNADKIIVLENGKIVGEGKHEDLLQNCEVYKQIAYSQLSKEELA